MDGEKIKLEEEAISEILVADTGSESGAEASDVEDYFEVEEEQKQPQQQQAAASSLLQQVQVTNLGTTSRNEHKYSTFYVFIFWWNRPAYTTSNT
jgi:hypothetical protein